MSDFRWPWWAVFLQSLGGLVFVAIALLIDDAYRTAELRSLTTPTDPAPYDWSELLSLVYFWPYVVGAIALFVVLPAHALTAVVLTIGLPIRLVPAIRRWWVAHYVPVILIAASILLLLIAWNLPAAELEVSTYQPSSPVFVVGVALGAFAIWHFWLPGRRAPRPAKPPRKVRAPRQDEEWRLGRLL
ncbi:hypothetical protein M2152_000255 [Microbacteriaceae bacterium SG_E_30_P1]|uniref:Uncharacterized protein n=1 Tax=Antiquaquibacter oligotrophicus TaxID=2880260 RepID=A0ABT6KJF3_9MICO|nr:hypothetical protein [Antiquaquibacter oligotrophicus]MDH6180073.1 hypothetical protein [Antiquaquibacter oligotrophicus]UDF14176.1 hypothetical protein LH407_04765 [Antiquaquibacter oligotrophicus]